jgi:hypothetical protein
MREQTRDVTYELLRGEEYEEVEFVMHYSPCNAEPDVGIMGSYVEDVYYTMDGKKEELPSDLAAAIEADKKWQERQIEGACEEYDEGYDDYPEYD